MDNEQVKIVNDNEHIIIQIDERFVVTVEENDEYMSSILDDNN